MIQIPGPLHAYGLNTLTPGESDEIELRQSRAWKLSQPKVTAEFV